MISRLSSSIMKNMITFSMNYDVLMIAIVNIKTRVLHNKYIPNKLIGNIWTRVSTMRKSQVTQTVTKLK